MGLVTSHITHHTEVMELMLHLFQSLFDVAVVAIDDHHQALVFVSRRPQYNVVPLVSPGHVHRITCKHTYKDTQASLQRSEGPLRRMVIH